MFSKGTLQTFLQALAKIWYHSPINALETESNLVNIFSSIKHIGRSKILVS